MSLLRSRVDAGKKLAELLRKFQAENPIILGLARGGVVVAREIARQLDCDFDVLIARKVGAPNHPEYGIGAVAPGGIRVADTRALRALGLSSESFDRMAEDEDAEVVRRLASYRRDRPDLNLGGRCAIVVDDGLATGMTALAAVRFVRSLAPAKVILAAPVCTSQAKSLLTPEAEEVVCLSQPEPFYAVGQWYDDFSQVEDQEVVSILEEAHK